MKEKGIYAKNRVGKQKKDTNVRRQIRKEGRKEKKGEKE